MLHLRIQPGSWIADPVASLLTKGRRNARKGMGEAIEFRLRYVLVLQETVQQ